MKYVLILVLLLTLPASARYYTTTFPLTENPISQGGNWTNGGVATGGLWGNIATNGSYAYGVNQQFPYGDPNGFLNGTWGPNQTVVGIVRETVDQSGSGCCFEVAIHLRFQATSTQESGYEINCSLQNSPRYIHIGSWDGPVGSFHAVTADDTADYCKDGDVFMASIDSTNTIRVYLNGVLKLSAQDTTCSGGPCHTTGAPGLDFYVETSGQASVLSTYGWKSYTATDTAGGTCPTNTNYVNLTTGAQTGGTLSSYGITKCYFIAASGLDTNSGTDETQPWLHAPNMPNCANNCATVQTTCNANNCGTFGFILRGGDTWHEGSSTCGGSCNSTNAAAGGTWNWSAGLPSSAVYVGVDSAWFGGGSWARPIITGDNPLCGPNNVGGACSSGSFGSYTVPQYYLTSCSYKVGANNILIQTSGSSHYIFDNLELTGLCQSSLGNPNGVDLYVTYGSSGDIRFLNLYLHGWSHPHYADVNSGGGCTGSNYCPNMYEFDGGKTSTPDDVWRYVVVDGSDSDPVAGAACYHCDMWDVAYSYFGYQGQIIYSYVHLWHDNLLEWWYEQGHGNVFEAVGEAPGTNAIYNNVVRHINTTADQGDPMFWPFPPVGTTDYWFNNLSYDVTKMQYFNVGQNSGQSQGTIINFNNTYQNNVASGGPIFGCASPNPHPWTAANNHYITEGSGLGGVQNAYDHANCNGQGTDTTSLWMNNATAASDSYTSSQTYAFSPTANGSPTVGTGTNETSTFIAALTTAGLSAAATAAGSDTTYGCTYNSGTHTMSCPARGTTARPSSGAWNQGTYQFNSTQALAPTCLPASGTVPQTVTCSNPNSGTTVICYRANAVPATSGDGINCAVGSTKYTSPVVVSSAETFEVIAGTSTLSDSFVNSYTYTSSPTCSTPTFSPISGTVFTAPSNVTISTSCSTVCYTTDGSTPTATSPGTCSHGTAGTTAFINNVAELLEAIGTQSGDTNSAVGSASYTLNLPPGTSAFTAIIAKGQNEEATPDSARSNAR